MAKMRQKLWTGDLSVAALLLVHCTASYLAEIVEPRMLSSMIEKYQCNDLYLEGLVRIRSHNQNATGNLNSTNVYESSNITLKCSKEDVVYRSIPGAEFKEGVYQGTLTLSSLNRTFESDKFCVVNNVSHHTVSDQTALTVALCEETEDDQATFPSHNKLKVRKCCRPDERLDMRPTINNNSNINPSTNHNGMGHSCVKIPTSYKQRQWQPAVFRSTSDTYKEHRDLVNFKDAEYMYDFPNCAGATQSLNNSKDIWFMLLDDGSVEIGLKFWFKPVWLPVEDNKFCLDEVVDHDPTLLQPNSTGVNSHQIYHKNQILVFCQIASFDDYLFHRRLFGGMCVTAAVIVFTLLIIYVAIYDKQNLAGWTQFNIFVALFFVVLMEGLRTLLDANSLEVMSTPGCVIIAAVAQYFFFALNTTWTVMCFDLFYMFWKLETTSKTVARYKGRLCMYLLFSWGLPLIVVLLAFYFSHSSAMKEMNEMKGIYAFAHRRCSSPIRKLGFQTQGIMFLLNLLFFLLTTALIWRHRRGINPAKRKSRNERHTWRSVTLFLKLVVVMGVTSLSIPLDYFLGSSDPLSAVSVCLRLIHFIPFFAVLFIFGFNEKNLLLISQKYPRVGKYFGLMACTSGATASDTANHSRSGNANRVSEHPSSQA